MRNGTAPLPDPGRSSGHGDRRSRVRCGLVGLLLAGLVALVLPSGQIRLGAAQLNGLVGSYLYAQPVPLAKPTPVWLDEIYLPKTFRFAWDEGAESNPDPTSYFHVQLLDSSENVLADTTTTHEYWVVPYDFTYGSTYLFQVQVVPFYDGNPDNLPPPPYLGYPTDTFEYPVASEWNRIELVPVKTDVTANQTADSRVAPRYTTTVYRDFQFASGVYQGGLFAGYAGDPSRVGRAFLRWEGLELPTDAAYWTGSVNAYQTGSFSTGNTMIGCQAVSDATWDAAALKWTTAPTLDPPSAVARFNVNYGSDPDDWTTWAHWSMPEEILSAFTGSGLFAAGVASTDELGGGWVYFAKKEYDSGHAPCLVYAYEPHTRPVIVHASTLVDGAGVHLYWNFTGHADEFQIERKTGSGSFSLLDTVAAGTSGSGSYLDTTVASGNTYTYRVRPVRQGRFYDYSEEVTATVP